MISKTSLIFDKKLCKLRSNRLTINYLSRRNSLGEVMEKSKDDRHSYKQEGEESTDINHLKVKEAKNLFGYGPTRFENPWNKWKTPGFGTLLHWKFFITDESNIPDKKKLDEILPLPNEQQIKQITKQLGNPPTDKIQVTWIGHATLLVQFDGITVLTDPVFREYCGPEMAQKFRVCYKRYRKAALQVRDIPHVDVVIVSHDHFDHLDSQSVKEINSKFPDVKWFVGKNGRDLCGNSKNVKDMEWWEEDTIEIKGETFKFACAPTQHWCRRTATDENQRLWCSWIIKGPFKSFYFAGDTGYYEPIFKATGERYGPFSLAAIPIGVYEPRDVLKYQHVNTEEAIQIHEDIRSELSIGIHWGTFCMSNEFYLEPPRKLEELVKVNKVAKEFISLQHGECWVVGTDRAKPKYMELRCSISSRDDTGVQNQYSTDQASHKKTSLEKTTTFETLEKDEITSRHISPKGIENDEISGRQNYSTVKNHHNQSLTQQSSDVTK